MGLLRSVLPPEVVQNQANESSLGVGIWHNCRVQAMPPAPLHPQECLTPSLHLPQTHGPLVNVSLTRELPCSCTTVAVLTSKAISYHILYHSEHEFGVIELGCPSMITDNLKGEVVAGVLKIEINPNKAEIFNLFHLTTH